jgi:DUF1365 family protein
MISEIHNTPWGEMIRYIHPCKTKNPKTNLWEDQKVKKMHVSPFFGMEYHYKVNFSTPSNKLTVAWELITEDSKHFHANMTLK